MKKIISLLLTVAMMFSMTTVAFAANFSDTVNSQQAEAIDVVETLGIVNGYTDEVFGPNDTLTRAQLCAMLTRALYSPAHTSYVNFKDVPENFWAYTYINTAYAYGMMEGYNADYFGPNDNITYTQMVAVIMKALGYDCDKMNWPAGINAMANNLNLFENVRIANYTDACTRAHAAQIIYNAFDIPFVNHKADFPVEIKNTNFLMDGLGFIETVKMIDGHEYVAYRHLKTGNVFETEIRTTDEVIIYPTSDGFGYYFKNNATLYDIDWYWEDGDLSDGVVLYVNGVRIHNDSEKIFANCEYAIGEFNANNELTIIHVSSQGQDYVAGKNFVNCPNGTEIQKHKDYKAETSTVTYFIENNTYVISNKVSYGFIDSAKKTYIVVDGVKIDMVENHGFIAEDFVKIYYNYRNEVSHVVKIDEPYRYDMTNKIYHTVDCVHVNEALSETYIAESDIPVGTHTFYACSDCQAEGILKISK